MEFLKSIHDFLNRFYPEGVDYETTIKKNEQDEALVSLKSSIPFEQFFLVLNLVEKKLDFVHGIEKWLGYRDETFGLYDYVKIIHPSHLPSITVLAKSVLNPSRSENNKIGFMSHHLVFQLPLRHRNGNFVLTKTSLFPFQIDSDGKVLSYVNHFVILKEFSERDALEPRVGVLDFGRKENLDSPRNKSLGHNKIKWSKKERRILELLIQKPDLTNREIAEELGISYQTLCKTDNHRITRKAKDFFQLDGFSGIKDVANFLKNQGLD